MADEVCVPLLNNSAKSQPRPAKSRVGIIGTGNYAVALSKRLTMTGYDVVMGSRRPGMRQATLGFTDDCLCGVELTSVGECVKKCDLIFIAIHMEDFKVTLEKFVDDSAGKILVDVSNREYRYAATSNAEHLASILPNAIVVKAFNSVSANTMEDLGSMGGNSKVFIASNDPQARAKVAELAKSMGFRVADLGGIRSARYMEDFVLKVFTGWKVPIFITFGIFNLWCLYIVYIYFIEKTAYQWEQVFLKVLNKPLCMTAITVLSLTYLPGHIASILQIYNGTKHRRFPKMLDTWLKSRKQFGLISFLLVTIHAIASVLMMSPTYYSSWFHKPTLTLPANSTLTSDLVIPLSTSWMVWKGEAACLVGITAFVLMGIIAVTSIPSVGEALNWSEWRCIHSKLSYAVLFLSVSHVIIMGAPGWAKGGPIKTLRSITFLSSILPLIVLFLKLIFVLPPLKGYLKKIRRGWERNAGVLSTTAENIESSTAKQDENGIGSFHGLPLNASCGCDQNMDNGAAVPCKTDVFSVNVQCDCSSV